MRRPLLPAIWRADRVADGFAPFPIIIACLIVGTLVADGVITP